MMDRKVKERIKVIKEFCVIDGGFFEFFDESTTVGIAAGSNFGFLRRLGAFEYNYLKTSLEKESLLSDVLDKCAREGYKEVDLRNVIYNLTIRAKNYELYRCSDKIVLMVTYQVEDKND